LADAGMPAIEEWWTQLDDDGRADALQLWQDCGQTRAGISVKVDASFLDEAAEDGRDFWHNDFYEYLVNHEIYVKQMPVFHICPRHPAPREAARLGFIPHDFSCPFASGDCPMRKLLDIAPGKSVRLRVSLTRKR